MPTPLAKLRRQILEEHGVQLDKQSSTHRKRIRRRKPPKSSIPNRLKTEKMRFLELSFGQRIEEILTGTSHAAISRKYSISIPTILKWKKKLKLNYTANNLPPCTGCVEMDIICQTTGDCHVLNRAQAHITVKLSKAAQVLSRNVTI